MKKAKKSLTALFVSLILGATAIVAGPDQLPGGTISYGVHTESQAQAGFLPQFDPTLGTLTDVTYSGNAGVGQEFLLPEPHSGVSYRTAVGFQLIGPTGELGPGFGSGFSYDTVDTAGAPLVPFVSFSISANESFSGDLGASSFFLGNNRINVQIVPLIFGDGQLGGVPWGSGYVTFTYTYAAVPEPPSVLLAGIAVLLPLSRIVKKRFSKRATCA
jgi:hypothetical protein